MKCQKCGSKATRFYTDIKTLHGINPRPKVDSLCLKCSKKYKVFGGAGL